MVSAAPAAKWWSWPGCHSGFPEQPTCSTWSRCWETNWIPTPPSLGNGSALLGQFGVEIVGQFEVPAGKFVVSARGEVEASLGAAREIRIRAVLVRMVLDA